MFIDYYSKIFCMVYFLDVTIAYFVFVRALWHFPIIAYYFFPWESGFSIGNSGTGDPSPPHHKQTIFGEVIHTLIAFIVSVMASNTVDGL